MRRLLDVLGWFKDAGLRWVDDHAAQLGAALAYYAIFAVGPLLLIAVSVAGLVFGHDAAQNQLVHSLRDYIGQSGAEVIQQIVLSTSRPATGVLGSIVGIALLLFGATGLFGQLDDALNIIWRVPPSTVPGWKVYLRQRFFSLTMVLGACFLLLVSLLISTALTVIGKFFSTRLPGGHVLWELLNFVFQLLVVSGAFGLIFKILPRPIRIAWSDVWRSALITAWFWLFFFYFW